MLKIADAHVDISDNVIFNNKKWNKQQLTNYRLDIDMELTNQVDSSKLSSKNAYLLTGAICPLYIKNGNVVATPNSLRETIRHLIVYKQIVENDSRISLIKSSKNLSEFKAGDIKLLIHIEGLYFINHEIDLEVLNLLKRLGILSYAPVWNIDNELMTSGRLNSTKDGVTKLGYKFIDKIKNLNLVLDLAHMSNSSITDCLNYVDFPVMFSHGYIKHSDKAKGFTIEQGKRITEQGGFIGMNFLKTGYNYSPNIYKNLLDEIKRGVNLFGSHSIGIGSDFDGMTKEKTINELRDVSDYERLRDDLIQNGLKSSIVDQFMFKNYTNFLNRVLD